MPAELSPGLGGITEQQIHLRRAQRVGAGGDMVLVGQSAWPKAIRQNSRIEVVRPVAIT